MYRLQNGKAQQSGHQNGEYLCQVRGQQKLNRLADIVIHPAALLHGRHNGGKVVVRQYHIRHVLGHIRAGHAHAYANIRRLNGRGVVDPVAGHGSHSPLPVKGLYNAHLMLRLHTGKHAAPGNGIVQRPIVHLAQLGAGEHLPLRLQDPQLPGNGRSSIPMIAGDHHRTNARLATSGNGLHRLRAHRIHHTHQPQVAKSLFQCLRRPGRRQGRVLSGCSAKHPQRPVCHTPIFVQDPAAQIRSQGYRSPLLPGVGAPFQYHIRRTLGVLHHAFRGAVERRHHLAGRVKGQFTHPGVLPLQRRLFQPQVCRVLHQRHLCGFTLYAVLGSVGVRTQRHSGHKLLRRHTGAGGNGHFILSQRAGFVRADHLRTAQGLHRRQSPDHCVATAHFGHADGQHNRHHRCQPLRNGSHRQGHRHHKGGQRAAKGQPACQ